MFEKNSHFPNDILGANNNIKLVNIHKAFSLHLDAIRLMAAFIAKEAEKTEPVLLIQTLLRLMPYPFVHGNGLYNTLFNSLLDLTSLLIDDLPKHLNKQLLCWSRVSPSDLGKHFSF